MYTVRGGWHRNVDTLFSTCTINIRLARVIACDHSPTRANEMRLPAHTMTVCARTCTFDRIVLIIFEQEAMR